MKTWIQALKEWNGKRGTWCIPRSGTLEHAQVLKLMGKPVEGKVKQMKAELESKIKSQQKKEESDKRKAKAKAKAPKKSMNMNIYSDF